MIGTLHVAATVVVIKLQSPCEKTQFFGSGFTRASRLLLVDAVVPIYVCNEFTATDEIGM